MKSHHQPATALLGCGVWGSNWARVLSGMGLLSAIADPRPSALEQMRRTYPGLKTTASTSDIFNDSAIEAVVIATPAPTHYETARLCLEAGKHVLVEKPLALSLSEGRGLVDLARQVRRTLMVGHLFEHHPAVVRLVELVRSGELGKLQYVYSHQLNVGIVRDQENALWSLAPHDIGLVLRVVDQRPEEVWATGSDYLSPGVQDMTMMHLKFAGGVRAHIFVNWLHPFKERRLVVVGERQMAVFDDGKPWAEKLILYPHAIEKVPGHAPRILKRNGVPVAVAEREPLQAEAEHFFDCIRRGQEPLTSGISNLRVLEVLEAAQRSLQSSAANWSGTQILHEIP